MSASRFWGAMTFLAVVFFAGILVFVYHEAKKEEPARQQYARLRLRALEAGVENCLARKRIPVFSTWDGRLMDCK